MIRKNGPTPAKLGVKSTIDLSNYLWHAWAMSRPLRIDYPNAWHHVMNRARRGVTLFVEADSYVLQLVRNTHRNPLKAGLVKRLEQYVWSSHQGYLSKAKK